MGSLRSLSALKGEEHELKPELLHRLFEDAVLNHGCSQALIFHDTHQIHQTTYEQLNAEANKLARTLIEIVSEKQLLRNTDGDYLVAVSMPPSDRLIAALLAIWKAGAAYLPLDVKFPVSRVKHILKESQPALVLYDDNSNTEAFEGTCCISYDELVRQSNQLSESNLDQESCLEHTHDNLAVVLYTSGSTGIPKGVRLPHRVILNRLQWQWRTFPFSETETVAAFKTALTFVDSVSEIWSPLLNGLALLVIPKDYTVDPERLISILSEYEIERLVLVPSLLRSLLMYLSVNKDKSLLKSLRTWVCSGESLPKSLALEFFNYFPPREHILCNFYGSTEIMGDVTYFVCESKEQLSAVDKVPIGYPVDNTVVYLLDSEYRPVQSGHAGELFISGYNVAAGYVNGRDPEKFIKNPMDLEKGHSMLFRTGDFARIDNGALVYEGRTDSQMKIRGNRVDLSEVEKAILNLPGVKNGIVLCYQPGEMDQTLLAFISASNNKISNGLQVETQLKDLLPAYMIPQVILLENLPVLVNGKIDRQALLKLYENISNNDGPTISYTGISEPLMDTARALFETIVSIIGHSRRTVLSVDSNFYQIGGNSLNSISTVMHLREKGYFIGITDFITSENLGQVLERLSTNDTSELSDSKLNAKFTIEPLRNDHKQDTYEVITTSFTAKGDLEKWLAPDILDTDYPELLDKMWDKILEKKLSYIAKDKNGRTVGVSLNFDARDQPKIETHGKLLTLFEFLETIKRPVRDKMFPPGVGILLHSFMMGTASWLSPQENISAMQFMEGEVLNIAKDRQFTGILTSNASPLTQQLSADVYGYQVITDFQVNTYVAPDGTKPFGKAPDVQRVVVSWKPINTHHQLCNKG